MSSAQNITQFHKGEPVTIQLFAKDPDGTVIPSAASQAITVTIATTKGGTASLTLTGKETLVSATTGEFTLVLTATDLTSLTEQTVYYYNIWSQLSGSDPRLQRHGQFTLGASISL